ncbi:hypothetical protein FNV43_RR19298 [Rhamnella rubrinervis]|uniref:Uncharacterized protein n=1 Tax=Rhamnella rubrinervis TaxID=2594499 RepID=A0A8K0GTQ8_9ROSA|nr:hypothetical protein FNV43_RR19298 [Rhamnella rubrinervis]
MLEGRRKLSEGCRKLAEGRKKMADGRRKLLEGRRKLPGDVGSWPSQRKMADPGKLSEAVGSSRRGKLESGLAGGRRMLSGRRKLWWYYEVVGRKKMARP